MQIRETYVIDSLALADAGTHPEKLDISDPLTIIDLIFQATNGATSNLDNPLIGCITRVDVIDGADVLYSMPGRLGQAYAFYGDNFFPPDHYDERPDNYQQAIIRIPWGRFRGDDQIALDPRRFKNPQVRVQWNLEAVRAVGATGYVSGTLEYTIKCHVLEEADKPSAFLMGKQIHEWTTAATGHEWVDMPVDYPYRLLLVQAYDETHNLADIIEHLKLGCDVDKFVALDQDTVDLLLESGLWRNKPELDQHLFVSNTDTQFVGFNQYIFAQLTASDAANVIAVTAIAGGTITVGLIDNAGVAIVADEHAILHGSGLGFQCVIPVRFGHEDEVQTWFPAQRYKGIKLDLTMGSADAEGRVVVQQLRPYAG